VPDEVRETMTLHFAMTIDQVLAVALEPGVVPACRLSGSARRSPRRITLIAVRLVDARKQAQPAGS
jgi:hypothetical protein